jgi:hypothetical protein
MLASPHSEAACLVAKRASEQAWLTLSHVARLALVLELPDAKTVLGRWRSITTKEKRRILSPAIDVISVERSDASPASERVRVRFVGDALDAS